ncbi:phage tail assembly protein [Maridesulfovibrio hydrothermalis]|uniref:Phage tail assembly chaperone protein, E, or 41 or 14 n=1 Tax=Maridesulfovibrio hydrothermalis AM13 = DSM 14728 TaxID=1121451 RepID=L0R6A7_9BACT|nr:phage tail assembly protein [Maridesulfovibrio hydrothermalis]CCO22229.1 conserved protein of unknown function [Maridesulfovibrio hydrothermalis AM13 = DSM 14728]
MGNKKITLSDGKVVTMRVPIVKDMRIVSAIKDQFEQDARMFCNLTGMTPEEIDALSLKDYYTLQKEFSDFLS